jgi:hypothetical protein
VTAFRDVSHYFLPAADAEPPYESGGKLILDQSEPCDAPECGKRRDEPIHQPLQVGALAVNADFGDTD